jgi:MFS transporter, DHA1 family, multidrug resistance protein
MEAWRKNLYSLWTAQFVAMIGLSMVVPFLPLYLRELGVKGDEAVKIWSGLIFAAPFMVGAFLQPIWGGLGDRYGRKPMIVRAMMGLALANFLMGFAQTAPQLLGLRLFQGSLAGFVAPSLALMASCTPEKRMGQSLGTLQSALVTGMIVGPLLGGFLAHLMGYRLIFFGTALTCFVAALIVLRQVQEISDGAKKKQPARLRENLTYVFHSPTLRTMILLLILVQLSLQIATPFMSLYVEHLKVSPDYIGLMTGLVFGITGVTNALTAPMWGKRGDRIGYGKILSYSLLGMTLASLPQALVTNAYQLLALRGALGIFVSGVMPTVNTIVQRSTDEHRRGGIYGIFQSGLLVGNVFGPLLGGLLAAYLGLRMILLINGGIMGLAYLWLRKSPAPVLPAGLSAPVSKKNSP